jgi:uncharacterized protein (TIGR02996 family)
MLDPTEAALIEDIRDRPDDPPPRLVHADWLEDHGEQTLAELVRIGCRLPQAAPDQQEALRARRTELLGALAGGPWATYTLEPLLRQADEGRRPRLWLGIDTFLDHADLLARLVPLMDVELSETTEGDERVLLPDELFHRVAESPNLASWTGLYLPDSMFSPTGMGILLASPHLSRLRAIDMFESFAGDDVLAWINVPRWPRLHKLHLNGVVQGDELTATLVRSGHLRGLGELTLIYNDIEDAGAAALAGSPDLAGLTLLELYGNRIGDEGARALARSPHLRQLRRLDIDSYGQATLSAEVQAELRERFGEGVNF